MKRLMAATVACIAMAGCADDGHDDHESPAFQEDLAAAWAEADRNAANAKADGSDCAGFQTPDTGPYAMNVTLTFDDGPHPTYTRQIMEVLRKHGAPATFFMAGSNVARYPDIVQEIIDDPNFQIAHHSWNHPKLTASTWQGRRVDMDAQLDDTLAAFAALDARPKYFRPPFGEQNCTLKRKVEERGMVSMGWDVDTNDWKGSFDPAMWTQLARSQGGNVLFHDVQRFTANNLDGALQRMKDEGYTFVGLDRVDLFPEANGISAEVTDGKCSDGIDNDGNGFADCQDMACLESANVHTCDPFIGDPCSADDECVFMAGGKGGYCLNGTVCVIDCAGYCPDLTGKASTFCMADPRSGIDGGVCVSQATAENDFCDAAPNTVKLDAERYIGDSGASARTATVCAPALSE